MEQPVFELISVGNELLNGKTLNTNLHFLGGELARLGCRVRRGTVVGDVKEEIVSVVRDSLDRATPRIILCGGLGPTFDDMTLEAIGEALGLPLEVHPEALKMLKERMKYLRELGVLQKTRLTRARLKMVTLPKGATALRNPEGSAPGVRIQTEHSLLYCLPGVPREMESIFRTHMVDEILRIPDRPIRAEKSIPLSGILESALAPVIDRVMKAFPSVYVKSHPQGIVGGVSRIEIQLISLGKSRSVAQRRLGDAEVLLRRLLGTRP